MQNAGTLSAGSNVIVNVNQLTDFRSGHSRKAEVAVMNAICFLYDLEPKEVTTGNVPGYDFRIQNTKIELKIASKGTNGVIELGRADGSPSGLSASTADVYALLNPAGNNTGKLRLIHAYELKLFYQKLDPNNLIITATHGDRIGSALAPFNIRNFTDLFIAECDCRFSESGLEFNTNTFRANDFARQKISDYIH